jgi:hypothetical protein
MIPSGEIRWLVVCGILLLPLTRAAALELEVGARFPAEPTEKIVVKNDGGVSNETDSFAFGEVCYSSDHLKAWFVVLRIVGDQVLVQFECISPVFGRSCPNGTATNMPLAKTRARLNAYAKEAESQFLEQLRRPVPPSTKTPDLLLRREWEEDGDQGRRLGR